MKGAVVVDSRQCRQVTTVRGDEPRWNHPLQFGPLVDQAQQRTTAGDELERATAGNPVMIATGERARLPAVDLQAKRRNGALPPPGNETVAFAEILDQCRFAGRHAHPLTELGWQ